MKLIGNLKKQVESENTMTGKKRLIEKAGMKLTDEELDRVAGGWDGDGGFSGAVPLHLFGGDSGVDSTGGAGSPGGSPSGNPGGGDIIVYKCSGGCRYTEAATYQPGPCPNCGSPMVPVE